MCKTDQNVPFSVVSVTLRTVEEVLITAVCLLYKDCGAYRIDTTSLRVPSTKLQSETFTRLPQWVPRHKDSFGFMSPLFDVSVGFLPVPNYNKRGTTLCMGCSE